MLFYFLSKLILIGNIVNAYAFWTDTISRHIERDRREADNISTLSTFKINKTECNTSGEYGENCTLSCPENCQEGHCNIEDGTCLECVVGYQGPHCEEECDGLMYGQNCNQSCGSCLKSEQCHHINGTCTDGCDRGYEGEMCTEECPVGRYGYNCEDTCSINCGVPSRCNRVTGECQDGCQAGFKDLICDKNCYCKDDFILTKVSNESNISFIECDGGSFGLNCTQSCGNCFRKEQCHHVNGTCFNGCNKGYQGDTCTQVCPNRRYGYNCEETCTNCSVVRRCDARSGKCNVIKESLDSDTSDENLYLVYGLIASLLSSVGLNVVLIIWSCRKKTRKRKTRQEKITTPIPRKLNTQIKVEERVVHASDDLDDREKSTAPSKSQKSHIKDEAEDDTVYEDGVEYEEIGLIEKSTTPTKTQIKDKVEDGVVYEDQEQTEIYRAPSKLQKTQIKDKVEDDVEYEDQEQTKISTAPSKLKTQINDEVEDDVEYEDPEQTKIST
ncbi:multiple epidermal growth factor-like domains protein 10 [Saccostrea cucullata]|uniref:multiple epidermal growth factor-like domains protein 10 n=1 Tax=Saccostrea cuccullata TaxID=36930 RepID=UPI002ED2096E